MTFAGVCELAGRILEGTARRQVVESVAQAPDMRHALAQLEPIVRANMWPSQAGLIDLGAAVEELDRRTRADGFHALHDWDGVAARVNPDTIPIDVLHYLDNERGGDAPDATALAILIEFHFLYLLGLLSLRVWDDGDPNQNLDRVTSLLDELQSANGSGHRFASTAETLLLIATSHYEPDERGYHATLERARQLDARHQLSFAFAHAASMGSHLRFGIEATYGRDFGAMRTDNTADYPWMAWSLAVLMREYARLSTAEEQAAEADRETLVEAIVCGLSADALAFAGPPSVTHAASAADRAEFRDLLHAHRARFIDECERHRPAAQSYSPLSLFFNFAFNVVKGSVIDALLWGEPRRVSLNDLFTALPRDPAASAAKIQLAQTLTTYARAHPDTIRGKRMPVVVYDPSAGRMAFGAMIRALKG